MRFTGYADGAVVDIGKEVMIPTLIPLLSLSNSHFHIVVKLLITLLPEIFATISQSIDQIVEATVALETELRYGQLTQPPELRPTLTIMVYTNLLKLHSRKHDSDVVRINAVRQIENQSCPLER